MVGTVRRSLSRHIRETPWIERSAVTRAWDRGQQGWPASFPLVQFPNVPLLLALAAGVVGRLAGDGAQPYTDAVASLFLGIWAYLELTDGVNWFRRALGAGFLVYVTIKLGTRLA